MGKIDLHIHTRSSDGNLSVEDVFKEAKRRDISFMSITDHDSIDCQERAIALAKEHGIGFVTGVELNAAFQYPGSKSISLDFLGYQFDPANQELREKLLILREHREQRALQILEKVNAEFDREHISRLTEEDMRNIQDSVDGAFGRPHIANYLVKKGIVRDKQEAFDKYLVKCDVPKFPLPLAEASRLIRNAGGRIVLAHPNDPNGTSLASVTGDLDEQVKIVLLYMLDFIDGIECWHSRHDATTTDHYLKFARRHGLLTTAGSDCHQKPIIMGTLDIPEYVAAQFR